MPRSTSTSTRPNTYPYPTYPQSPQNAPNLRSSSYPSRPPIIIPGNPQHRARKREGSRSHNTSFLSIGLWMTTLAALIILFMTLHNSMGKSVAPINTCQSLIRDTDYTKYVQLQAKTQQMGAVQDISQLDGGQPAALVPVTNTDTQQTLDVYVYGCVLQQHTPSLVLLFKQQRLAQGTVSISQSNTLILGERDTTLSPETTAILQPMQQNIYQEYHWQSGQNGQQGTFVRVLFPGLYPVTSRSEAEALQQQANAGQQFPWTDPQKTSEQMAKDLFQWQTFDANDKVLDNDGTTAHILLVQPDMQVVVTLSRLVQHDAHGLWFVTHAQSQGITLNTLPVPVTPPLALQGNVSTSNGNATATLFDHTLTRVSSLNSTGLAVQADGSYSGSIYYTGIQPNQQAVLLIENIPPDGVSEQAQLLLTSVEIG